MKQKCAHDNYTGDEKNEKKTCERLYFVLNQASFVTYILQVLHFKFKIVFNPVFLGVSFRWKDRSKGKKLHRAFISQDVEEVIPEWVWIDSTFRSRSDASTGGQPLEIINQTRWSENDPAGKMLSSPEAHEWFVLKMPAYDKETDSMLCEQMFNRETYLKRKATASKNVITEFIFDANYDQETVDKENQLYKPFKTYAELRVRGAILDGLRELDWVPRSYRRRQRELESAYRKLEAELGRSPTSEEAAKELSITLDEYFTWLDNLVVQHTLNFILRLTFTQKDLV